MATPQIYYARIVTEKRLLAIIQELLKRVSEVDDRDFVRDPITKGNTSKSRKFLRSAPSNMKCCARSTGLYN